MDITIKSRSGRPTEEERSYLTTKLQKLGRYLDDIGAVHVDVARSQQRGSGEVHTVQAMLATKHGTMIRAEEHDPDFNAAVDALHDTLQRQLTRFKERHFRRGKSRRGVAADGAPPELAPVAAPEANGNTPRVVKTKQFVYKPMNSEEAIEQMELLDHDFFVFTDASTNLVNVVYRRRDGNYGLIEQETS